MQPLRQTAFDHKPLSESLTSFWYNTLPSGFKHGFSPSLLTRAAAAWHCRGVCQDQGYVSRRSQSKALCSQTLSQKRAAESLAGQKAILASLGEKASSASCEKVRVYVSVAGYCTFCQVLLFNSHASMPATGVCCKTMPVSN